MILSTKWIDFYKFLLQMNYGVYAHLRIILRIHLGPIVVLCKKYINYSLISTNGSNLGNWCIPLGGKCMTRWIRIWCYQQSRRWVRQLHIKQPIQHVWYGMDELLITSIHLGVNRCHYPQSINILSLKTCFQGELKNTCNF